MGKISQSAASNAAYQIAKPLGVKSEELLTNIKRFLMDIYLKETPKEVIEFWKKYPKYTNYSSVCYVYGQGIGNSGYNYHTLSERLPSEHGNSIKINLSPKDANTYVKMKDAYDDMDEKFKNTKIEIENTLLTLGTHKKIAEVMPNALRFLPETKQNTREVIVQIQPIVDKVNCLITNEDKCVDKL
jgi:hypothetical protein